MSEPTETEMLDWIALYLTTIETFEEHGAEKIGLVAADGSDFVHVVALTRDDPATAFRQCLRDAMHDLPRCQCARTSESECPRHAPLIAN